MVTQDRMKVGRIQSWMENGNLKLYSHEVGAPGGISCSLSAEEALGLLDLLSRHCEDIAQEESDDAEEDYTGGWIYVGR